MDVGGTFTQIDFPGAILTRALGINSAGQIVGEFQDARGFHGFLRDVGGTFTQIDVPNGFDTSAHGINDAGQIVGFTNGGGHGFLASPPVQGCSLPLQNNPGDTIAVMAKLSSIDVGGQEGPLRISISGEQITTSLSDYGFQTFLFSYVAKQANETITGTFEQFDNDESCEITATFNRALRFTPAAKELARNKVRLEKKMQTAFDWFARLGCPVLKFKILCAALNLPAVINAAAMEKTAEIAGHPTDTNFTVIAVPNVMSIPPVVPGGDLTAAEATKINALLANQAAIFEIGTAAVTSANRAEGAHDAGNSLWEMKQTQAVQFYATQLGPLFGAQADILSALHDALVAGGVSANITPADVLTFEQQIASNGLPADWVETLTELGGTQGTIDQIRQLLINQDINTASGNFPDILVSPDLIATLRGAAAAFSGVGIPPAGTTAPQLLRVTLPGDVTFAAFGARLQINSASKAFDMNSTFTLGPGGTISPVTQPVTIQVGNDFLATIPAGSFRPGPQGKFLFDGVINNVALSANLTPLGGGSYAFRIEGAGAPNLPGANPVEVWLAIGNNGGSVSVNADF